MTKFLNTALATALVAAQALAGLTAPAAAGPTLPGHTLKKPIAPTIQIAPGVREQLRAPILRACVDLAVFAQETRLSGDQVRITYGARNVSSVDYVSGGNQQAIVLSLHGRDVHVGRFDRLNAGQTASWSVIVRRPLEFPHTYRAVFSHDPDLYIDGNTANDDCNRTNNQREVVVSA